ncbi:hypothetical protein [Actinoplanes sp. URMC 104]|uniref:hypothetical protein n=1 Tax=Actinoplanes sp. URMC 104 TaxID=3423409 RepID=UPI003F1CE45C
MADELAALGWNDAVLLRAPRIWRTAADMAVRVDREKLARRMELMPQACLVRADFELWEQVPELGGPPSPITYVGAIFGEQSAMRGEPPLAFRWRSYGRVAVRTTRTPRKMLALAHRYGIAVLKPDDGGWQRVEDGLPRFKDERTVMDRFLEEHLFDHMLRTGHFDKQPAGR